MESLEVIKREIDSYHQNYRHPNLAPPRVSSVYDLFPVEERKGSEHSWPRTWPNNGLPGVYFIFDENLSLLYIGKAKNLGSRLSSYFMYASDRSCRIKETEWRVKPHFIVTASIGEFFEAPSLEEYLIEQFQPSHNSVGVRSKPN
ncbi:nucleotide excision repair endonuclease [Saccharospirillum alexandrii]|uniref:nucleotide excision repair endonuclease n=1 Tax=Saccharospirillum alexandrii TaxID=2448477 RepID=UPI000FDAF26C|nr:nucleotide excision repair endonuclease [Saccharospirillum alexandrii]